MSRRPDDVNVFPNLAELIGLRGAAHGLELGARRLVRSVQSGGYRSVYRGRGLEFDEVRIYQPGDEVRRIDWNVTARTGALHVRQYREEREIIAWLVVDQTASMDFGTCTATRSPGLTPKSTSTLAKRPETSSTSP